MADFKLISEFKPQGDQAAAIKDLVHGLQRGDEYQTLLGVTGSGKTFSVANVISEIKKPTLIISHNKTLAAQLYGEFKQLFPNNAVEYFISYYDYYQPEAYLPVTDTFIEKDSSCEVTFSLAVSFSSFIKEKIVSISFEKIALNVIDAFERRARE